MKTINTEELVIASLLLLGEAIGFITTHLLVPGISLILAGLGWRPPTRPEVEPPEPGTPYLTQAELRSGFFPTTEELQADLAAMRKAFWSDAIPADDLADDYRHEVPTAEERSPSLHRRSKR
jgi:hypothetical protein